MFNKWREDDGQLFLKLDCDFYSLPRMVYSVRLNENFCWLQCWQYKRWSRSQPGNSPHWMPFYDCQRPWHPLKNMPLLCFSHGYFPECKHHLRFWTISFTLVLFPVILHLNICSTPSLWGCFFWHSDLFWCGFLFRKLLTNSTISHWCPGTVLSTLCWPQNSVSLYSILSLGRWPDNGNPYFTLKNKNKTVKLNFPAESVIFHLAKRYILRS